MNLLNLIMNNVNKVILHATAIFALNSKLIFDYFPNKEYIFCHGGTSYREAPQNIRFLDNIVKKYIIQCPDLLGYSPTHITEKLIYYPIEIKKIKPNFNFRQGVNVLTIGHWPSTKSVKGTAVIFRNTRVPHAGKPTINGERMAMTFMMYPTLRTKIEYEEEIKAMDTLCKLNPFSNYS